MKKYLIILSSLLFFSCENLSKTKGIDMTENKPKVVGVGGVFFKSENPEETKKWYEENLGLPTDQYGTMFKSRDIDNPDEITEYGEIGKFVHILDPEGNKIELWEPPKSTVEDKK